jgi:hypothetical protein
MLGRGHNTHSEQSNLMNGDMRSAAAAAVMRRTAGMFDPSPSSLYSRNFGAPAADVVSSSNSRARSNISDNFTSADNVVGSVVESAIGEIDNLSLDDLSVPFDGLSRSGVSSLVNGNADTLIEHHHPSEQSSASFLSSSAAAANPDVGLSIPGSAPVNIPGRMAGSDRTLSMNTSPPVSASPLTSSLGHSLDPFGLSPFRQQLSSSSQPVTGGTGSMSEACQLFKKMFFPRFNLFLTLNRYLYYPESLSDVAERMILNETYCKFELKWKEVLRELGWGQKELSRWMNSNFPVMKDFAMTVFGRYSREIMVNDRAGKEVVDDDFMDQLLSSRSITSMNSSSAHMM